MVMLLKKGVELDPLTVVAERRMMKSFLPVAIRALPSAGGGRGGGTWFYMSHK